MTKTSGTAPVHDGNAKRCKRSACKMARKTGKASRRKAYKRGNMWIMTIEVDKYIAEIVKYKETQEQKHRHSLRNDSMK